MNTVALIGRLVADPELRSTGKGKESISVLNFTIAVQRIGSEDADFPRCVAFGKTAEFIDQYFRKGTRIGITGRIQTGKYENKDGDTVWTTDVIVERADFADGKEDSDDERSNRSAKKGGRK